MSRLRRHQRRLDRRRITHLSNQNDIRVLTERRIKPLIIALYVHAHLALVDDRLRRFIDILDRVFQRNHMEWTILVDLI